MIRTVFLHRVPPGGLEVPPVGLALQIHLKRIELQFLRPQTKKKKGGMNLHTALLLLGSRRFPGATDTTDMQMSQAAWLICIRPGENDNKK
jgi:hypothetical protein